MSDSALDCSLPTLSELLPEQGAPAIVAQALSEMIGKYVRPEEGVLDYFEYRPRKECRMLWTFPSSRVQRILISGKIFFDDKGERLIQESSFRKLAKEAVAGDSETGSCYFKYLPERRLLLQLFPFDSKLRALVHAVSKDSMRGAFAPALGVSGRDLRVLDVDMLAYKPWGRATLRYTIGGLSKPTSWVGKLFHDDRGQQMLGVLKTLPEKFHKAGVPWELAQAHFYLATERMLVMEAFESAVEVKTLLAHSAGDSEARRALFGLAVAAAEGLSAFQRISIPGLPESSPETLLKKLHRATDQPQVPGRGRFEGAELLSALVRRLENEAAQMTPEPLALGHGAFRHTHFLVRDGRPALIDLDDLCIRGVSADAGEFLAYVTWTRCRQPALRSVLDDFEETFLTGLRGHKKLSRRWLAWHRAAGELKWALHGLRSRHSQFREKTEAILGLAANTLSGLSRLSA
jgi:hypothetical protein